MSKFYLNHHTSKKLQPLVGEIVWAGNFCRSAAHDGSRGFQPTVNRVTPIRRGATVEMSGIQCQPT
jgi:hypothetical protein